MKQLVAFGIVQRTVAVGFTFALLSTAAGAEYVGATQLINTVIAQQPADNEPKEPDSIALRKKLADEAKLAFKHFPTMEPAEAARQWVGLVKKYVELPALKGEQQHMLAQSSITLNDLFQNIPGPASWPEIRQLVDTATFPNPAHNYVMQCVTAKLTADDAGTSEAFAKLKDWAKHKESSYGGGYSHLLGELEVQLVNQPETAASLAERFERLIELRAAANSYSTTIQVPDLVQITGEETARRLLEKAIGLKSTKFEFSGPNATQQLAKEIALERMDSMVAPRWNLVQSLDSAELYEAMEKKFSSDANGAASKNLSWVSAFGLSSSEVGMDSSELTEGKNKATAYHYLDLLAAGRTDDADKLFTYDREFLSELDSAVDDAITKIPKETVYDNLVQKAEAATTAPHYLWRTTQNLSMILNRQQHHTAILEKMVKAADADEEAKANMLQMLGSAYLHANEVDKAVEASRQTLALGDDKKIQSDKMGAANLLVRLGQVLERPEWITEGIDHLKKLQIATLTSSEEGHASYDISGLNDKLVLALLAEDRGGEAEQAILELLKAMGQGKESQSSDYYRAQLLEKLVLVYDRADRHADVMALLEEAPWWGAEDLTKVQFRVVSMQKDSRGDVAAGIAKALAASGHKEEAIKLLKQFLISEPSNDKAYKVLVDLAGDSLIPWLDDLAGRDRFEERPLIWKAVLLQKGGKLKEAEAAARQAMQVDPTDGEQPKGARLLAYAVLADILAASGNTAEADTLKKVVAAVRLAERGDELNELGLASQAVKTYEEASRNFSDAYCVEWRLAKRLQEQGDEEGATLHYTKAFELMPNQFGRMANLCFGCESIFAMEKPQSIAEQVLTRMMENPPVKATVYQLMGQLREEQGRFGDAADNYRKATEIDPKYYDALKSLFDISEKAFLPDEERNQIAFRLIELDPYMRHFSAGQGVEVSPTVLWNAGERNRKWGEALTEPIFALPASAARLEELKKKKSNGPSYAHQMMAYRRDMEWPGPGQYLVNQEWLQNLMRVMQYLD